jgi:acetyl-CoA carboxylase carboxyl transferase subunit alpha
MPRREGSIVSFDLDFERPLARLDEQIQSLLRRADRLTDDQHRQLESLRSELERHTDALYSTLTPWQRVQVSRHRQRPHTADYVKSCFDDFFELRGDRRFADDRSILAGLASLGGRTVMLIGHEKGRDTKERQECNFGCPHPEGYRKAQRLLLQAERLHLPVVTLIDTQGAFPGLEDEERGQAEAIAENLMVMARLRTPIVCVVIGEGGSGGALAIGVGDRLLMLRNAYYTVAAPEAAASILWRDANKAPEAAAAMKITAPDLLDYGLIDRIVEEPRGGAHRDWRAAADLLRVALVDELEALMELPLIELLARRDTRLRNLGAFTREPALVK